MKRRESKRERERGRERERERERGKEEEAVEKHLFFFIDSRINRT